MTQMSHLDKRTAYVVIVIFLLLSMLYADARRLEDRFPSAGAVEHRLVTPSFLRSYEAFMSNFGDVGDGGGSYHGVSHAMLSRGPARLRFRAVADWFFATPGSLLLVGSWLLTILLLAASLLTLAAVSRNARRLRAELKLATYALSSISDGFVLIDARGKIRAVNPAFSALLGYDHGQLVGHSIEPLFRPGEGSGVLTRLRREGSVRNWEVTGRGKHGDDIVLTLNGSALQGKDGNLLGILALPRVAQRIIVSKEPAIQTFTSISLKSCRCFSLSKEDASQDNSGGGPPEKNKDAFAYDLNRLRFAIADGVTESQFAGEWAQILVKYAIEASLLPWDPGGWVARASEQWDKSVDWAGLRDDWAYDYVRQQGAASTLLGLSIEFLADSSGRSFPRWRAFAVGDSCVFQVRSDRLIRSFPISRSDDFTNTPWFLASTPEKNLRTAMAQWAEGDCAPGDLFLLMTDALAQWFLASWEHGAIPWAELVKLEGEDAFGKFVLPLRQEGRLRNDDTTLVIVSS
jgi:PAS domain S-box-containing protein